MKNTINKLVFAIAILFFLPTIHGYGQKTLQEARVYINPGHGGFGSNDRPLPTINYALKDTLGFFETKSNLLKSQSLYKELEKAGVGYVKTTRNVNGVVAEGDPQTTSNDLHREGDVIDGVTQIVTLSVIAADVEANNMDYFISIHSNAHTDGAMTNYPLLLYRGTDAAVGNGLVDAKNMAFDAWKYIVNNGITYYSAHNSPTSNNTRGDLTFMNSAGTTNDLGYLGYYGVLKHGCDGYISEGSFHTYQPERQRLLNPDYSRQEGVRQSRAIRAWFGDNTETKGAIMGTVKDKYKTLEHALYKYAPNSVDAYLPLNNVTVVLKNSAGTEIGSYTTDNEYNGVYVFTDLEPGTYTLVYDFAGTEYIPETATIEVKANETSHINKLVADTTTPPPYPFLDPYYPEPEQDGDIAAPAQFEFEKEYELADISVLQDLTVRRAILRDNKYYVLAVDAAKAPKLFVLNPTTGELIKEMSTEGIVTEAFGEKEFPYVLSDISFTNDGVLIGTNSTVVGRENNGFQTGDFYVYKWQASETETLEDSKPTVVVKLPTNTSASLAQSGNNFSNFIANSIAVKGNSDNFYLYFNSHAGDSWTSTSFLFKIVSWKITNGELAAYQWTDTKYVASKIGSNFKFTYSPFGDIESEDQKDELHRIIVDSDIIKPLEFRVSWTTNTATEIAEFSGDLPLESNGTNFFRYLDEVYMTTIERTALVDNNYSHKVHLYNVTKGLNNAISLGTTEEVITSQAPYAYVASAGIVNNANIDLYLFAGDNIVKFKSKEIEAKQIARIFASELVSKETETGYDISYVLNETATSVELILTDATTGELVKTIALSGLTKGLNTTSILFEEIPQEIKFNWSIKAMADNITKFVKISDDSEKYRFFGPKGVAVDKSTESKYFGRVYVTNSDAGDASGRATTKGIYILGADGSDVTSQGATAHTGNISWDAAAGVSPRKVAVANDGRVFISDYSINNSGIYYMNPENQAMSSIFTGATRETTHGKLTVGDTYVGGRTGAIAVYGSGADTRIYGVDRSAAEATSWWKNINTYNIGEAVEWTAVPSAAGRSSSYIGNDNNSLSAVEGGYWAAQYRGAGSETAGNPFMFYYSNAEGKAVYNTYTGWNKAGSSQNGGMTVNEKEKLIALAFNNGAAILSYEMVNNVPVVSEKFISTLNSTTYDDFAFDYAGNLYAVSYAGKLVSVWSMPTSDNSCTTPAQKSMILENNPEMSVDDVKINNVRVYPNPIKDFCTIESVENIDVVEVFSNTGMLIEKVSGNASRTITLDTSRYLKGVYLVKVNQEKTVKVIKQ